MLRRDLPDWYADLTLAAIGYLAALALAVVHVVDLGRDDAQEALRLRDISRTAGHPGVQGVDRVVQAFGQAWFLVLVAIAVAGVLAFADRYAPAAAVLAVTGAALVVVSVGKLLIRHPVVDHAFGLSIGSFPSGHTADATAVLGVVLLALLPIRLRLVPYAVGLGIGVLVGGSRVVSGAHTPDDAVAGWLLGAALVLSAGTWLAARAGRSEGYAEQRVHERGDPARR